MSFTIYQAADSLIVELSAPGHQAVAFALAGAAATVAAVLRHAGYPVRVLTAAARA